MPSRDHLLAGQQILPRSGSHHRRASSGLNVMDPEVQAIIPRSSPSRSISNSLPHALHHSQPHSPHVGPSNDNPSASAEEHLRRISEGSLKFVSLPGKRDDDEVPEDDENRGGKSGLGIAGGVRSAGHSLPTSPHTTNSYRLRQASAHARVPISRTASTSEISLSQQTQGTAASGYGTIPNTPRCYRSVLQNRMPSSERRRSSGTQPVLGLFGTDNREFGIPRAMIDGILTRRSSRQDFGGTPSSSNGIFRSLGRKRSNAARSLKSYDGDILDRDGMGENGKIDEPPASQMANGTRMWYSSYVTIDWLHDQIKDCSRRQRIRKGRRNLSFRGIVRQGWDKLTGWVIVTLIGIITALIAYCIIKTETILFDLKVGYCSINILSPKKKCCPTDSKQRGSMDDFCEAWTTWESFLEGRGFANHIRLDFVAYLGVALALAVLSSTMTVYLTSSANHECEAFPYPAGQGDDVRKRGGEEAPLMQPGPAQPEKKVRYFAAGSGIPEVKTILSGFVIHGYLGISTLIVKSIGLALSVASGLSLGKEGPIVHIAAAVGNIICRQFPKFEQNEGKKREILSAACASGVSVAFGAPIGGVLFSLEEVSYYFPAKVMWRAFFSAAVATWTLRTLNPYSDGRRVLLETHYSEDRQTNAIYAVAVVLGIFGGLYGAYFNKLNIMYSKRIRGGTCLGKHPILEVAMVVTITALLSYPTKWGRMGGVEYVAQLFSECNPGSTSKLCDSTPAVAWKIVRELSVVMALRAGLTVITFGIRVPAGIFIPSLAAGAAFGRIFGISMQQILPQHASVITPGVWALIGAGATLAGVTRTTVSLVVIILELTGDMSYSIPTAISVLVAKSVADAIEPEGIYDAIIRMNQFPYLDAKKTHIFGNHQVADVVDSILPILKINEGHTVFQLVQKLDELLRLDHIDGSLTCVFEYEVDDELALGVMGLLSVNDLQHALDALSDQPEAACNLIPHDSDIEHRHASTSIYSFGESVSDEDPYDLVPFIDQAPLTITIDSPLELVQQLFVRMGARTIVVTDRRGRYRGLILKKHWLKFLEELDDEVE